MKIKDLISQKDYDYISIRLTSPPDLATENPNGIFFGACKSENGKLIELDYDTYDENTEILSYEEWSSQDVPNGLTVLIQTEWKKPI